MRSPLFVFRTNFLQPLEEHEGRFSYAFDSCSDCQADIDTERGQIPRNENMVQYTATMD